MRRRLVLAIAGVAALAVVLFAVPLGYVLAGSYRDKELLRLQRDTVAATRQIDIGASGSDPIELPRGGDRLAVYDRTGRRLAGRGPARADGLVREALRAKRPADHAGEGQLLAAAPLVSGERVTGAVRAVRSDAAAARSARRAWLALAGLAAGLVAAATLAALLLGRRLARPLERLAVAARRLGHGEFAIRAPRSSVPEADAIARALDATAERLHELVARERAFSSDASHQLRTPLAALRLELEALELRGERGPELTAALREVDRLQGTVDTLLAVARDAPRRETTTDLAATLDDLTPGWRASLAERARPLRVDLPARAPLSRSQPAVIREILEVMLSNAVEHGAGAVTVAIRDDGRWVHVEVSDEGRGIAPDRGDVFARRSGSGHGIGLALARSLAHAEGGRLSLVNRLPGATFRLTLPSATAPAEPTTTPVAP
jgi:signal transduction histidine kinase